MIAHSGCESYLFFYFLLILHFFEVSGDMDFAYLFEKSNFFLQK